ncbi:MAG: glycerophosphodiester phosphodiesterase family protein [Cryomorphaceae bacterium]
MNLRYFLFLMVLAAFICGCTGAERSADSQNIDSQNDVAADSLPSFDFQGHRGCRGLLPENTIPGFIRALDLGVTTLEMDVVITSDRQVILSHEPWFSHEICRDPNGVPIAEGDERNHLIYGMTYAETQAYDCGASGHPNFLDQVPLSTSKPLLAAVLKIADTHAVETGRALPFYNIETKSTSQGDGIMHPAPDEFARLLAETVKEAGVEKRTVIQSFDVRTLQYLDENFPEFRLALLIENGFAPSENLENLGFTPDIYSPDFHLVDEALINFCREENMDLIPWTVNEVRDMEVLIEMGVNGLISDYPDRFSKLNAFKKTATYGDKRK